MCFFVLGVVAGSLANFLMAAWLFSEAEGEAEGSGKRRLPLPGLTTLAAISISTFALLPLVFKSLKARPLPESATSPQGMSDAGAATSPPGSQTERRGVGALGGVGSLNADGRPEVLFPRLTLAGGSIPRVDAIAIVESLQYARFSDGRHHGRTFAEVHANHPEYLTWLHSHIRRDFGTVYHMFLVYATLRSQL